MKYTVCAYFDTQLKTFNPPFVIPQDTASIIEGVRAATIKGKVEDAISKQLFLLGYFETADGSIELTEPTMLADLSQYVVKDA